MHFTLSSRPSWLLGLVPTCVARDQSRVRQELAPNRKQPAGTPHTHTDTCDKTKLEKNLHIGTAQNSN